MNTDQIAAEAAERIFGTSDKNRLAWAHSIIKTAIEKAYQRAFDDGRFLAETPDAARSRAAHASEQNLPCPTCGQPIPDSMLEKIAKAVLQEPAHASEQS